MTDGGRCADLSAEVGESLAATASTAHDWLLVEVRATWPRDVSEATALGEPMRAAVDAWMERAPAPRLLFIRRPGRARGRQLVFVVRATERESAVRRIEVEDASELAEVDLAVDGERTSSPLVLVCGHGTRDPCCALRGSAVYTALSENLAPDELWLSSHQGGHRFAANVLVLPSGIQLGRVAPGDAMRIVHDALAGRISLDHYRGRTAYTRNEQAAERAVREAEALVSLSGLRLVGSDGGYVRFRGLNGREYAALVEETKGPVLPPSCGATPEEQPRFTAQLV